MVRSRSSAKSAVEPWDRGKETDVTCRELADFIMDYLAGELPPEVRAAFEHHLTLCPDCVNYLEAYKATVELSRRAFTEDDTSLEIPEDLVKAILASRRQS
jgi:anti-sigma factor RsiW